MPPIRMIRASCLPKQTERIDALGHHRRRQGVRRAVAESSLFTGLVAFFDISNP
jgi:hypothetical protein